MADHLKEDLLMKPITGDLACFSKTTYEELDRMIGFHVDDFIGIRNVQFNEESRLVAQRFESRA